MVGSKEFLHVVVLTLLLSKEAVSAIRFVIDREECFSHDVKYEGDTVHVSFVVVQVGSFLNYGRSIVDLVIKGPSGNQIYEVRDKISEKYEFTAVQKGVHRFCLINKSRYHGTIDFEVRAHHFFSYHEHVKDEHVNPLLEQISKLEEALYNIQFDQHWLRALSERQAKVNDAMSRRTLYKAIYESVAMVGLSFLQVYLLRRLFERKRGTTRV